MKKLTVLVLLLFSLTISCKKFISQKTKINGYVTNLCNDSLVGGVTVELSKKSKNGVFYSEEEVVTDEDGNFNFEFNYIYRIIGQVVFCFFSIWKYYFDKV